MNVTLNKITKNINIIKHHYEPASLHMKHVENVALGGQIVVHHNRKVTEDEDDDDSYGEDDAN
jgi:acyl-ACP thioesterase